MKLILPLDNDRIKTHEIIMTDAVTCIDEYWEYLVEHFEGTPTEVIERLVYSYSDALWTAVLDKSLKVEDRPLYDWIFRMKLRVLWWINQLRLLWGDW